MIRGAGSLQSLLRVMALCFAGASTGCGPLAAATDAAPAAGSAAQEEGAVVAHLNANLDWYHQVRVADGWVMQPSDAFYEINQRELTNQVLVGAFAYARAMVAVIAAEGPPAAKVAAGNPREARLATLVATNTERLAKLRLQQAGLKEQLAAAQLSDRTNLLAQSNVVQAEIDLDSALGESLKESISVFANSTGTSDTASLSAQIAALQRAEPEVFDASGAVQPKKVAPNPPAVAAPSGLVNRAAALFSLIQDRRSMDSLLAKTTTLQAAANGLAEPLATELRAALQAGDEASQGAEQTSDPTHLEQARQTIESQVTRFRNLSAALMPLRQEAMALEKSGTNLTEWKTSTVSQTDLILRDLFVRAIGLGIALAMLVAVSEVWRRATFKYVHDARRRRQFLLIRRFATTALMVAVIVMEFVGNFSSLATFAGFIIAGIAVALQAIILSVAAYFFLIGRYGVRVGDRVTVSGVTGDVIDIGLVRVFLMELAGTGINLQPTGRVVVLANSALFSTNPLYKQLPGTDYAWHEVYVTMSDDSETSRAEDLLLKAVKKVYEEYRASIERQHGALERLLDYKTDLPVPTAHVRLTDSGLEVVVRYPVEIRKMAEVDDAVTKEVLAAIRADEILKKTLAATPRIRAAVKS